MPIQPQQLQQHNSGLRPRYRGTNADPYSSYVAFWLNILWAVVPDSVPKVCRQVCLTLLLCAMAGRALRARPSHADDLKPWQTQLTQKLLLLHQECHEKHQVLTRTIQGFLPPQGDAALAEISYAAQIAWNLNPEGALERAKSILAAGPADFIGTRTTCILSWSFDDESLWRGLSDNKKIIRLARSMVTSGYREDEPINSRTLDLTVADGVLARKLLFGDGQARGLAARLAFQLVLNEMRQSQDSLMGDPEVMRIMQGLIQIPTVFTRNGEGSVEDQIVAQAVRQNVKAAMQLPMNCMEWAGMVLRMCKLPLGISSEHTKRILLALHQCTAKYDAHLEVEAYDVEPVAKRARKGRRKGGAAAALAMAGEQQLVKEPEEDRIKLGRRRLTAITKILSSATPKSYEAMQVHLVWAGDYAISALSDECLAMDFIWPNSLLPEQAGTDEVTLVARDAAAQSHRDLITKGVTVKPMQYEELLTTKQHELVLGKICLNFEDSALHQADRNQRAAAKPKMEQWLAARQVIQHWDFTMRACCEADLTKEEFDELEKAILYGDAMDAQILKVISRFPKSFHIGMIPDMRTNIAEVDENTVAQEQVEAEQARWQAELRVFTSHLTADQKLIQKTQVGSRYLQDFLQWNEAEHVRKQGQVGKSLVNQFIEVNMPKAQAQGWAEVPGAVALLLQSIHNKEGAPKNYPRFLAILDFNTPNSRDALKINEVVACVANIFKCHGPERCVLLAHMAAFSKEDSEQDPVEDEIAIMKALQKAGFHSQQRVRMLLQQPPGVDATLTVGDWHADSRLCYLAPNDMAARGTVAGLPGNQWRMGSELARTTVVVARPMVPKVADMVPVTFEGRQESAVKPRMNKEEKAAQRGPLVAQAYLEALFTKAAMPSTETSWIQPEDETWVIDLTAWAGDRGMASLNLMDEARSKFGTLKHVFVDPGYKRLGQGATFAQMRVSNEVAGQWMARSRVLHDRVVDERGGITRVPKQPMDSVPMPAEDILKEMPGAFEAWKGLSSLDLNVCVVRGPKIVIAPERLAAFQHAPLSISEDVAGLEKSHREYEDVLSFMASGIPNVAEGDKEDPRENEAKVPPEEKLADYVTMDSLAALEAFAPGLIEHQCFGDKHVTMYKDVQRHEMWLLAKNDDHIVLKATVVGGFGAGTISNRRADGVACVPWSLPNGDKTYVQLMATGEDDTTKAKPKVGTFYTLIKPLEKAAGQKGTSLTLTSYGKIQAKGTAGKHGFAFELPDGHTNHEAKDYVLSTAKTSASNSGNFFASLAARSPDSWAGCCISLWRLDHDSVRHKLHARKPMVMTQENIRLKKGVPTKVLWQRQGDAIVPAAPAQAAQV